VTHSATGCGAPAGERQLTGEPLGDAVAELYKVSGWWLRNFHGRPEHKQQALQSVERVIGLLNA
jgi:hypothetical protein